MRNIAAYCLVPVLLLAACGPDTQEQPTIRASVAIMAEVRPGAPLDEILQLLDEHLGRALEGRMEGDAVNEFRRAEAISDRLLEARMPFEWIAGQQYSLEARLRQIQSLADRVLAMVETGVPRDTVLSEVRLLREQVVGLRETIAQGGTRAPPHIHQLLQGGDTAGGRIPRPQTAPAAQPRGPTGPRPLGQPVPPGGN